MRILFLGDVIGRPGRSAVIAELPRLRRELCLDFAIVNGENAAHGFGITAGICQDLYDAGVDVITTGNHVWAQQEIIATIGRDERLLRPLNYPDGTPGRGVGVYRTALGAGVLVVNVMGRVFMDPLDDPFAGVEAALAGHELGADVAAVVIDVHAEATSEKMAIGHAFDGRASLIVGSHSHVPTADAQILPGGTAFQCDAGMCGDYDSVIGMKKHTAVARLRRKLPGERFSPAEGPVSICGVFVETEDATGLARQVAPLVVGGRLTPRWPLEDTMPQGIAAD